MADNPIKSVGKAEETYTSPEANSQVVITIYYLQTM
jgi:hypothetical protein